MPQHPVAVPSPKVSHLRGQVAASKRHYGADDPRSTEAARELREAMLAEQIKKVVDSAPPLSSEQRARLAVLLLAPSGGSNAA
jgi:hypothetical protein